MLFRSSFSFSKNAVTYADIVLRGSFALFIFTNISIPYPREREKEKGEKRGRRKMSGEPRVPYATENNNNATATFLRPPLPSTSNSCISLSTSSSSSGRRNHKPIPPSTQRKPTGRGLLSRIFWPDVGWRPPTLQLPFHLAFMAITVASIIVVELLLDRSLSRGAVTFDPPGYVVVLLDFGPLAFGVAYGLVWASVDHDVKRCVTIYYRAYSLQCSHEIYIRLRVYR